MKIAIVIPNYNGAAILEKNLPSVIIAAVDFSTSHKESVEIVIVDDKSIDNSIEVIESIIHETKEIPIYLLKQDKNYGFSSTVNNGVKHTKAEYVVLLNTDVRPEKNFLSPLITHFTNEQVFAVGCMDKSIEKDKIVLRGRGIGWWRRGFLHHKAGTHDKNTTLWVSGGSSMYRKKIWDMLGGMNEFYNPFYWEDIDLSYRAQKAGYIVLFEKTSVVTHEHEKGAIKSKYSQAKVREISYRNQILFAWMNITDRDLIIQHLYFLPYQIVQAVLRKDGQFLTAIFQALQYLPKIVEVRRKNGKLWNKKDKQIQLYS